MNWSRVALVGIALFLMETTVLGSPFKKAIDDYTKKNKPFREAFANYKEIDVNEKDEYGQTILFWAIGSLDFDMVEYLIAKGADINALNSKKETPIFKAILFNYPSMVKVLVEKGADLTVTNKSGETPLKWAKSVDYRREIIDYLTKKSLR